MNKEWKKKYVTLCDNGLLTYHPSLHVSLGGGRGGGDETERGFLVMAWVSFENASHFDSLGRAQGPHRFCLSCKASSPPALLSCCCWAIAASLTLLCQPGSVSHVTGELLWPRAWVLPNRLAMAMRSTRLPARG